MNWNAIEAVGSLLAAFATTAAVLVALYESGAIFNERISIFFGLDFVLMDTAGWGEDIDIFEVKVTNKGNKPVYMQSFGFSFGKNVANLLILNPEYGSIKEPILPGKNSVLGNNREALIDSMKKLARENKGLENKKVKVFVVTELKTYYSKTKYKVKDIINSEARELS